MLDRSELVFGVGRSGLLTVRPRRGRRLAALQFSPQGVQVGVDGLPPVGLWWDDFRQPHDPLMPVVPDGWFITYVFRSRNATGGLAVQASGTSRADFDAMLRATTTMWRRWSHVFRDHQGGRPIPVQTWISFKEWFDVQGRERATMEALCTVLARCPEFRERLGDNDRMFRLAGDLQLGLVGATFEPVNWDRDSMDLSVALKRIGCVHRFGRPLSTGSLRSLDHIVDRVEDALDSNAYRQGRSVLREWVEARVRKLYYDVEPWPFAALVE